MLVLLRHPHLRAQEITSQAPPGNVEKTAIPVEASGLPNDPDGYPVAHIVPAGQGAEKVVITSDNPLSTQSYEDGVYTADRDVVITYKTRRVEADHLEYDSNSHIVTATGHLVIVDTAKQERISASHGTYNLEASTGRFYDVAGSIGIKLQPSTRRTVYTTSNPFLFTGRLVVKTGPESYDVYDGTVTSCQLPRPDWLLSSSHFSVADDKAKAHGSVFHLMNLPILYLPFVTHPTDAEDRQSGFMIPTIGQSSTRGFTIGEQIYMVINRSTDLTVGAEYYSLRGWAQNAAFRYRGANLDFINVRYSGLLDKLQGTANQGGEDLLFAGRHDLSSDTRMAANVEYLSSYIYREAFTDNFNQAVTSDITSTAYIARNTNGFELAALADRYQGIKLIAQGMTPQQQVRIFHVPTLSAEATDHRLGVSGLEWSFESSASGLKRSQPNLITSGIVERFDLHPEVARPFSVGQWRFRPEIGARETVYSRSRNSSFPGVTPVENVAPLSRSDVEFNFNIRPPVLEAEFTPPLFKKFFGPEVRHTIEPEINYRLVSGINNFANILRFDATDVAANTNELEYGVTQRLFRRHDTAQPCPNTENDPGLNPAPTAGIDVGPGPGVGQSLEIGNQVDASNQPCGNQELLSWRLTQKVFFDQSFGGAVVNGRRNIFDTTLDLSGVAFLTEARELSPLISRLRLRTSSKTDIEWDFDLDAGAKKFTSSNVFLDLHQGNKFAALSYARLDAPGRFFTEGITNTTTSATTGVTSAVSDFNQLRLLLGYGAPTKQGLSIAANTGLDLKSLYGASSTTTSATGVSSTTTVYPALLQYIAVQTSYNWNCCGIAFEYRKFELGTVKNSPGFKVNFTLANIGAAGNLRRAERLF